MKNLIGSNNCENKTILIHHGIKGQRWGVRRFQNEDGSLTSAGKKKKGNHSERNKRIAKGLAIGLASGLTATGIVLAVTKGKNFMKKSPSRYFSLEELAAKTPINMDKLLKDLDITDDGAPNRTFMYPKSDGTWKRVEL